MILIGYSGHAYVVYGILKAAGKTVEGYCDATEKTNNPFELPYIGKEEESTALLALQQNGFFIAIGDNTIRNSIYEALAVQELKPFNAVHPSSLIDGSVQVSPNGVMIGAHVTINPLSRIGTGVICNTGCIIEHECMIGDFAHIAPGTVLCGNVTIGKRSFVGANAVIRQGITIGNDVMIGAGAVVVKDVGDGEKVMGVPAR